MALTKCKECDGQISSTAERCPHCGANPHAGATAVIAFLVIAGAALFGIYAVANVEKSRPSSAPAIAVAVDSKKQSDRKKFIDELIAQGIFDKVEAPGKLPHVWVGDAFSDLSFDDKKTFVEVVYAYYFPDGGRTGDLVVLRDSRTGQRVGRFSKLGLQL